MCRLLLTPVFSLILLFCSTYSPEPELLVLFRVSLHSPARLAVGKSADCRHQGRRSHPSCLCKSFPPPSWLQFYTFPCLVWYFPGFWRENKPSFNCFSLQPAFSVLLTPPFTFHLLQIIIIKVYYCLLFHSFSIAFYNFLLFHFKEVSWESRN